MSVRRHFRRLVPVPHALLVAVAATWPTLARDLSISKSDSIVVALRAVRGAGKDPGRAQ